MATSAKQVEHTDDVEIVVSPDEAREVFDRQVRALLPGISGDEFIRRWEAGEYDAVADQAGNRHIMRLALMIPRGGSRT